MGEKVYRVSRHMKRLATGKIVNIAIFAYQSVDGANRDLQHKLKFRSGCFGAERYVASSDRYTGWVVLTEDGIDAIQTNVPIFTETWFREELAKQRKTASPSIKVTLLHLGTVIYQGNDMQVAENAAIESGKDAIVLMEDRPVKMYTAVGGWRHF